MYQQVNLTDHTLVGTPGPLPANLIGLPDDAVADISAVCDPPPPGMAGQGWWAVVISPPESFDPASQVVVDPVVFTVDPASHTVTGQQTTRAMTADELAAAPVSPVSGDAIIGVISKADAAKVDVRDLTRIAYRDDVPASNAKLGRIAKAIGTTPDALRAAAVALS